MIRRFLNSRCRSVRYAAQGLTEVLSEPNFRIQLFFLLILISAGIFFKISIIEWGAVLICSAMVMVAEVLNTAIERILDHFSPQQSRKIGVIKDIAAGAVLLAALFALIIGLIIFLPYLIEIFNS